MGTRFRDETIWVTGASSGIGAALARAFAAEGARLVLSARRVERLQALQAALGDAPAHAVVPFDLERTDELPAIAASVLREYGPIDVLVLAGGLSQRATALETSLEVDRRLMQVDYFSCVALTKAVLPSMLERGQGQIVPVSSLVGLFGSPLRSGYAAAKHALHGFFDSLRAEVHDQGIRVTLLCPGFVRTEVSLHALRGDGSPQGKMDRAQAEGMDPDRFARRAVNAVWRQRSEVYLGGREVLAVYLKRWAPALLERILRTARVT